MTFSLNGRISRENATGNIVSHMYDLGHDLHYGLIPVHNDIQVVAVNGDNVSSAPYMVGGLFGAKPLPLLPGPYTILNPGCVKSVVHYRTGWTFPDPLSGNVTPPSWFPYIGGNLSG